MPPLIPPEVLGAAQVAVTAQPRDTYTGPRGASQLEELAGALSSLAPSLARFSAQAREKEKAEAQMIGEQLAANLANSRESWAAATREGKIAAGHSPWVRFYAAQKMGETAGQRYAETLALKTAKLPETASLQQWEEARAAAEKEFLTANAGGLTGNLHFMNGFRRTADNVAEQGRARWVEVEAKRVEKDALTGYANGLTQAYKEGAGKVPEPALVASLNAQRTQALALGVPEEQLDKITVDALAALAVESKDSTLVERLAKGLTASNGTTLDKTFAYTARDFGGLKQQITERQIQFDNLLERERDEKEQEALSGALDVLNATGRNKGGAPDYRAAREALVKAGVRNVDSSMAALREKYLQTDDRAFVAASDWFWRNRNPGQLVSRAKAEFDAGRMSAQHYHTLRQMAESERDHQEALAREAARRRAEGIKPLAANMEDVYKLEPMRAIDDAVRGVQGVLSNGISNPLGAKKHFTDEQARLIVANAQRRLAGMIVAQGAAPDKFQLWMDNVMPLVREEALNVAGYRAPTLNETRVTPQRQQSPQGAASDTTGRPVRREVPMAEDRAQITTPIRTTQQPDANPSGRPSYTSDDIVQLRRRFTVAVMRRQLDEQDGRETSDRWFGLTQRDVAILREIGATSDNDVHLALNAAERNARRW